MNATLALVSSISFGPEPHTFQQQFEQFGPIFFRPAAPPEAVVR